MGRTRVVGVCVALVACVQPADKVEAPPDPPADDPPPVVDTDVAPPRETGLAPDTDAPPPPEDGLTHRVRVLLTADDAWAMWIDGVAVTGPNALGWQYADDVFVDVPARPRHVVAVAARDEANVISGLLAAVWITEELYATTGDPRWRATDVPPEGDAWKELVFDDSAWATPDPCPPQEAAVWGDYWQRDLLATGAAWIWTGSCRSLGRRWFRLIIE